MTALCPVTPAWLRRLALKRSALECLCVRPTCSWSAGPAYWMSQNLLGVKPATAGFGQVEIKPMLTESLPSVAGTVPSVLGAFEVSFDLHKREANLSLPAGMLSARLELGLLPLQPAPLNGSVRINGGLLPPDSSTRIIVADQSTSTSSSSSRLIIEGLTSGNHRITWALAPKQLEGAHSNELATPAYPTPRYPSSFLRRDDTTQGNWKGRYGSAGYLFFTQPPPPPPPPPGPPPTPPGSAATCAVVGEAQPNSTNMKPLVRSSR